VPFTASKVVSRRINADWLFGFESYDGVPGALDEPVETGQDTAGGTDGQFSTVKEVLGRPPRSYAQWAREHAADFAGTDAIAPGARSHKPILNRIAVSRAGSSRSRTCGAVPLGC
jgi:hypothetical protein